MKKATVVSLSIVGVIIVACLAIVGQQYYRLKVCNIESRDGEAHIVYVYPNTTMDSLLRIVGETHDIHSPWSLRLHTRLMKWQRVHEGAYMVYAKEGDMSFIRRLRAAEQTPVKMTIGFARTTQQLSGIVASQLMLDSLSLISRFQDSAFLATYDMKPETAICLFQPDTYEMFWNISPDHLFEKMNKSYCAFWNDERRQKAQIMGLSQTEVATLASIVEGETFQDFEKPIVAGLYYNRLRKGMKLQADPTVIFAWQDFSIRRVMSYHLKIDSPYNTYKYAGLPPGPIRDPKKSTIDAVLNYDHNNYIYMCANADFSMTHKFASSYAEHLRNAREYQRELNKRGIK